MNCPKCLLLEMRVDRVEDNKMYYKCKNCGTEEVVELPEDEEKDE